MDRNRTIVLLCVAACIVAYLAGLWQLGQNAAVADSSDARQQNRLVILWTSGDRDVALKMAFMYAQGAQKNTWWDQITVVVWGPSSKLLSVDTELQATIKRMMKSGIKVQACIVCANLYGVTDKLRQLDIEVKGMGKPLSDMLQSGWTLLSV